MSHKIYEEVYLSQINKDNKPNPNGSMLASARSVSRTRIGKLVNHIFMLLYSKSLRWSTKTRNHSISIKLLGFPVRLEFSRRVKLVVNFMFAFSWGSCHKYRSLCLSKLKELHQTALLTQKLGELNILFVCEVLDYETTKYYSVY